MNTLKYLIPLITSLILVGCGGSTAATPAILEAPKAKVPVVPETPDAPTAPTLTLTFTATKAFQFTWEAVAGATSYKLKEAITNGDGYTLVKETTDTSFDHIVLLFTRLSAKYILESCNAVECVTSAPVFTSTSIADLVTSIDYVKASNTGAGDYFGGSVSLSEDGNTLAVGAPYENGSSMVISENVINGTADDAGAVYVFTRTNNSNAVWSHQAYLKASNAAAGDNFGISVSLSGDGNTLAVGAAAEASNGTGGQTNNAVDAAGAAYVFTRNDEAWSQQTYLKAKHTGADDQFGFSVSLSGDGNTLAVGAFGEDSNATGIDGDQTNNEQGGAGAVYVFIRSGAGSNAVWSQQEYLKASNLGGPDSFGNSVSLSADGNTLAVGARLESGSETGVEGTGDTTPGIFTGAVYVFIRTDVGSDAMWVQQQYLKASNTGTAAQFGYSVSLSADGNTLAVGADGEKNTATGINPSDVGIAVGVGAVYVFKRDTAATSAPWSQQAYIKAGNAGASDRFGVSVSLSVDGSTLVVGATDEGSNATGIDGEQGAGAIDSGAVYAFTRAGSTWSEQAYIKASNTGATDHFGYAVAISSDGGTLAAGAWYEASDTTGVNGDEGNNDAEKAGAVYVY